MPVLISRLHKRFEGKLLSYCSRTWHIETIRLMRVHFRAASRIRSAMMLSYNTMCFREALATFVRDIPCGSEILHTSYVLCKQIDDNLSCNVILTLFCKIVAMKLLTIASDVWIPSLKICLLKPSKIVQREVVPQLENFVKSGIFEAFASSACLSLLLRNIFCWTGLIGVSALVFFKQSLFSLWEAYRSRPYRLISVQRVSISLSEVTSLFVTSTKCLVQRDSGYCNRSSF